MTEQNNNEAALAQQIGHLTGEIRAMHAAVLASIEHLREDMRRLEDTSNKRIERLEDRLSGRLDAVETKIGELQSEDKRIIEKVAKLGALGGGASGALVAGLVEILKRVV
ncbi:hypothetical protein PL263_05035 [Methylomonas sp. EFPC3]|uniref:hypothetical protein n=1 Tax=unclassified Methylomonas TaxID=2608980 RepID=UPI0024180FE8|nr:hypothetical protein [Methylomonas sp. EFPC3]WFP51394.1 hypothetical protein PL263_05035 [Methylomonas sp. EFPC3]